MGRGKWRKKCKETIALDKEGVEVSAYTAVLLDTMMIPKDKPKIIENNPFIYIMSKYANGESVP